MRGYVLIALMWAGTAQAQDLSPTPRVADIQWPEIGPSATASGDSRFSAVDSVRLPVLVPDYFLRFKSFELVADPLQYMVAVELDWGTLQLFGTRVVQELPGQAAGINAAETVNFAEQSVEVGQQRYGAAYLLRIECRTPNNRNCTDAGFARSLLTKARVMGGLREGEAIPAPAPPAGAGPTATSSATTGFVWSPPGELTASAGHGNQSTVVYAPGIRFPVERAPAYLGSMVYGYGGLHSPIAGLSWKDSRNYNYPWQDNFCEKRPYVTAMCPSGHGHQGVDIRPMKPEKKTYWAVAAENGVIGSVKGYTVSLLGKSGTRYDYLHMEMGMLNVKSGQAVKAGDRIGLISDNFGKTKTPVHLHFEIRQFIPGRGVVPVPPYMSLVRAYEGL